MSALTWPADGTDLPVVTEVAYGADPGGDRSGWTWTDESTRLIRDQPIRIKAGQPPNTQGLVAGSCSWAFGNDDGDWTPFNPHSARWPYVRLNLPVRQRVRWVYDAFGRTVSNGWGSPDRGSPWGNQAGAASQYATTGTEGTITPSATNVDRFIVTDVGLSNHTVQVKLTTNTVPTGAAVRYGLVSRYSDASNYYRVCAIVAPTTGVITLEIAKRVAGTLTVLATVATLLTISSDTNIAFSCADDQLRAKVWQSAGDPEWMLSTTDTDLTAGTYAGAMARRETGSGALTTFGFDDFQVYNGRFAGNLASVDLDMIPTTDGDPLSVARLTASGVLRRLSQNDKPLKSALTRAMIGDTAGDFRATAHWAMEDGQDATQFASSLSGQAAATYAGDVSLAAYDGFPGSLPVPILNAGGMITATMPTHTATGVFQLQHTFFLPSTVSGDADLVTVKMVPGSGTVAEYRLTYIHSGAALRVTSYDAAGNVMDQDDRFNWSKDTKYFANWTDYVDSGTHLMRFSFSDATGTQVFTISTVPDGVGAGSTGMIRTVTATATADVAGWSFGQLGYYTDPNVLTTSNFGPNALAAWGYDGELPTDRLDRLCREQGESIDILAGGSTQPMGPQTVNTFLGLLSECAAVDGGVLGEQTDGFGLAYVPIAARLNRHVGATVDLASYNTTSGTAAEVLAPTFDDQGIVNDVTVSRPNGSSYTAADAAHIALYGHYEGGPPDPINVQTDDQLVGKGRWLLALGTTTPVRYPDTPIHLHGNVATLLSPWLGLRTGLSRIARTNLPTKAGAAGDDRILDTYSETLEPRRWTGSYDGAQAAPYKVGTWGGSRWGMLWQTLAADANIAATSWSVATATGKTLPVTGSSAPNFPMTIIAGGLEYEVTAISGSSSPQTFTVTPRADGKLQTAGTQITLKDPLRWAPV